MRLRVIGLTTIEDANKKIFLTKVCYVHWSWLQKAMTMYKMKGNATAQEMRTSSMLYANLPSASTRVSISVLIDCAYLKTFSFESRISILSVYAL